MGILVLLFLNSIAVVFMQTCDKFQVQEIIHANKYSFSYMISCSEGLSLEQCALECLYVTRCKSFNHFFIEKDAVCELLNDDYVYEFRVVLRSSYVNIGDWPQDVAKTCKSRPCTENQRCIPTNPYRCMDIDCGMPPVLPYGNEDTNMHPSWINTTIGSRAKYRCLDSKKLVVFAKTNEHWCYKLADRICSSDSLWSTQDIFCAPN